MGFYCLSGLPRASGRFMHHTMLPLCLSPSWQDPGGRHCPGGFQTPGWGGAGNCQPHPGRLCTALGAPRALGLTTTSAPRPRPLLPLHLPGRSLSTSRQWGCRQLSRSPQRELGAWGCGSRCWGLRCSRSPPQAGAPWLWTTVSSVPASTPPLAPKTGWCCGGGRRTAEAGSERVVSLRPADTPQRREGKSLAQPAAWGLLPGVQPVCMAWGPGHVAEQAPSQGTWSRCYARLDLPGLASCGEGHFLVPVSRRPASPDS